MVDEVEPVPPADLPEDGEPPEPLPENVPNDEVPAIEKDPFADITPEIDESNAG